MLVAALLPLAASHSEQQSDALAAARCHAARRPPQDAADACSAPALFTTFGSAIAGSCVQPQQLVTRLTSSCCAISPQPRPQRAAHLLQLALTHASSPLPHPTQPPADMTLLSGQVVDLARLAAEATAANASSSCCIPITAVGDFSPIVRMDGSGGRFYVTTDPDCRDVITASAYPAAWRYVYVCGRCSGATCDVYDGGVHGQNEATCMLQLLPLLPNKHALPVAGLELLIRLFKFSCSTSLLLMIAFFPARRPLHRHAW